MCLGFGAASFFVSVVYYLALPYFIYIVSFGSGLDSYLNAVAPAPVVVFLAGWLYGLGMYFLNQKLIYAAQTIIFLYIGVAIIVNSL